MGAGDVKLAAVLGFTLGWPLITPLLLGFAAFLGFFCIVALALGYRGRLPAVPALALSYMSVIMLHMYWRL